MREEQETPRYEAAHHSAKFLKKAAKLASRGDTVKIRRTAKATGSGTAPKRFKKRRETKRAIVKR